jgi:1-acyl-sn-glycerol-3-phosphate acyltransferase
MIKKELFFPPLGWILRAMGGIPVDRKNSTNLVRSIIANAKEYDTFHIAIAPEGTRKAVKRWKTGFHTIARHADMPVYLGYFDWSRKVVGRGQKFELTDDAVADMKRIQQIYEEMNLGAKHPDQYVTQ